MKMFLTLATLTLAGATMVGCQSGPKVKPTTPISDDQLNSLRAEFTAADAGAKLGAVDEVLDASSYLRIGQITAADWPVGTVVAIFDSNKQVVANGNVVKTAETSADVKYEKAPNKRPPRVGDVAVHY